MENLTSTTISEESKHKFIVTNPKAIIEIIATQNTTIMLLMLSYGLDLSQRGRLLFWIFLILFGLAVIFNCRTAASVFKSLRMVTSKGKDFAWASLMLTILALLVASGKVLSSF